MGDLRTVVAAYKGVRAAEADLGNAVGRAFPCGAAIEVPRGRGVIRGKVVGHSPFRPMEVRVWLASNGHLMWVSIHPLLAEVVP